MFKANVLFVLLETGMMDGIVLMETEMMDGIVL